MVMFEKGFGNLSSGFSLERLRRLVELAQHGYIAKAAGGNPTTSNLISRQIGELEGFFGTPLRKKEGKLTTLSEKGKHLAEITANFLKSLEDFQDQLDGLSPRVVVGAGQTFLTSIILPCFAELKDGAEGARVVLKNMESLSLVEELDAGSIDLALVSERRLGKNDPKKVLGKVDYKLYAPMEWVSKIKKRKAIEAIFHFPLAIIEGRGERRSYIDNLASKAGKSLKVELECSSHIELMEAVKSGCFCAILPNFLGRDLDPRKFASFNTPELKGMQGKLCIAWKKNIYNYKPRIDLVINAIHETASKFLKSSSKAKQ